MGEGFLALFQAILSFVNHLENLNYSCGCQDHIRGLLYYGLLYLRFAENCVTEDILESESVRFLVSGLVRTAI